MAIHLSTERFVTWLTRALSMATATKKHTTKNSIPDLIFTVYRQQFPMICATITLSANVLTSKLHHHLHVKWMKLQA